MTLAPDFPDPDDPYSGDPFADDPIEEEPSSAEPESSDKSVVGGWAIDRLRDNAHGDCSHVPSKTEPSGDTKAFPDEDLSGLDFDIPVDFVVPDDISELENLPPATHHEDPDGTEWDDPDWLLKSNSTESTDPDSILPNLEDFQSKIPRNTLKPPPGDNIPSISPAVADSGFDIDAELAEMTGEVVELAMILTPVADARALAAACVLVGVDAIAVPNPTGAVAVLRNTGNGAPEKAVFALSGLLPSFPLLLITKASSQLNAVRYVGGQPPQEVPAGLVVAGASGVVEDLIIGQVLPTEVPGSVTSSGVTRTKAVMWLSKIAKHRRQK